MQETTGAQGILLSLVPFLLILVTITLWKLPSIRRDWVSSVVALKNEKILQIDVTPQVRVLWVLRVVEHVLALRYVGTAAFSLGLMILKGVSFLLVIIFAVSMAITCAIFYNFYTNGRISLETWKLDLLIFPSIVVLESASLFLLWDILEISEIWNTAIVIFMCCIGTVCVLLIRRIQIPTLGASVGSLVMRLRSWISEETFSHHGLKPVNLGRGVFFAVLAAVLFVGGGVLVANATNAPAEDQKSLNPFLFVILLPAYIFAQRARRYLQLEANTLLAVDRRPPIVFLRPFNDDNLQTTDGPTKALMDYSLEARLSQHFFSFGPFVAITDPRDTIPQIGAARLKLSDDEWQQAIVTLVRTASVIIVYLGKSKWINWELTQLINNQRVTSTILVMPEVRRWRNAGHWEDVSERAARMRSAFRDTPWADQINEVWDFSALRALALKPDGAIVLIETRSTFRESYHLSVLIAHTLVLESTTTPIAGS